MATRRGSRKQPAIRITFLARGYFPKELPPFFTTIQFANYAATPRGRQMLRNYRPAAGFTECVSYHLALPGGHHRQLQIPHPYGFNTLAAIVAQGFPRLLKKNAKSQISRSRAVYGPTKFRALSTMTPHSTNRAERALTRAGASYLLRVDVSQFYPSLYTHAVGWAVDPSMRLRANWGNRRFLGKRLDQALMDLQGKVSQGIPIGNDLSFLLAEIVLAQVDNTLKLKRESSHRWFDDYELAFSTREEAERCLAAIKAQLQRFRLRINPKKSSIVELPEPTETHWADTLHGLLPEALKNSRATLQYFDTAFRLRREFEDQPVLMYALGNLFSSNRPDQHNGRIAEAAISQALLCEPGVAQKAFALLTYWKLNQYAIDTRLLEATIEKIVLRHASSGATSDVAWALSFCIQEKIALSAKAGRVLCESDDDTVLLLTLHLNALGLLGGGFKPRKTAALLRNADPDGEHWLLAYEATRQRWHPANAAITGNALFADLLAHNVSFLRLALPSYALVIHQGGAPEWVVRGWVNAVTATPPTPANAPAVEGFLQDLSTLIAPGASAADAILELLDAKSPNVPPEGADDESVY